MYCSDYCGPKSAVQWTFGDVGYAWLATIGSVCGVFYGLGIPLLFWSIMHVNRAKLKHREYTSRFGFLSNKMSEEYPWWECVICIRKLLLTYTTVKSGGHSVRASLTNMIVLFFASFLQFQFAPYAQKDANLAETATLVSTVFVLVVGIGQQAVLGPTSQIIQHRVVTDDSEDSEDATAAAIEVLDTFNIICYIVMGVGIIFTICVILRRLGMAKFLYEHTMDEESRLGDDVLDMIKKSHIDTANAWAGIIAEESDLRRVTEVFTSIREFKTSMQFMAAAGLDAWHGSLKTHLAVQGESALHIISGVRQLTASDVRQMAAAAGIQDLPDESVEAMRATIQRQVDIERLRRIQKIVDETEAIEAVTNLIVEQASRRKQSVDEHGLRDELQPLTLEQLCERATPAGVEDMRSPHFAKFFPQELVPTLHAWMSWADPKMILELDNFVRSISEINREQIYAAVPKRVRKRLIKAAQPAVAINRQSMIRSSINAEADFELEEFQPDDDPVSETASASNQQNLADKTATHDPAALEHAERIKRCTAMLGFNPFEEDKDSSMDALRLTASDPFNLRKSKGKGLSQGLLDLQGSAERRKMEHAQRILAQRFADALSWLQQYLFQCVAGLATVFVLCVGVYVYVQNAGCCSQQLESTWEGSFFDLDSCSTNGFKRGTMCKVSCKQGYRPADCASAGSNCVSQMTSWTCGRESRLSPKWHPAIAFNESNPPHCVKHGCYVGPDELTALSSIIDTSSSSKNPRCKLADQVDGAHPKCGCLGPCTDLPGGNFSCKCQTPGYSGPTCGHSTGCDSNPYCGRGSCVAIGADYSCECEASWSGPACQWQESDRSCPTGAAPPEEGSRYCGAMEGVCRGSDGDSINSKHLADVRTQGDCATTCDDEPACVGYTYYSIKYLDNEKFRCKVFGPGVAQVAEGPWIGAPHANVAIGSNHTAPGAVCVAVAGRNIALCVGLNCHEPDTGVELHGRSHCQLRGVGAGYTCECDDDWYYKSCQPSTVAAIADIMVGNHIDSFVFTRRDGTSVQYLHGKHGGGPRQDLRLTQTEYLWRVMQYHDGGYTNNYLGNAFKFVVVDKAGGNRTLLVAADKFNTSSMQAVSEIEAPVGEEIVGLQFAGSYLVGIHTGAAGVVCRVDRTGDRCDSCVYGYLGETCTDNFVISGAKNSDNTSAALINGRYERMPWPEHSCGGAPIYQRGGTANGAVLYKFSDDSKEWWNVGPRWDEVADRCPRADATAYLTVVINDGCESPDGTECEWCQRNPPGTCANPLEGGEEYNWCNAGDVRVTAGVRDARVPATTCQASVKQGGTILLGCPTGGGIKAVTFAQYATASGECKIKNSTCHGAPTGDCQKGFQDNKCGVDVANTISNICVGKVSCAVSCAHHTIGSSLYNRSGCTIDGKFVQIDDPCYGTEKFLSAKVLC
jgi:hypothetical protein